LVSNTHLHWVPWRNVSIQSQGKESTTWSIILCHKLRQPSKIDGNTSERPRSHPETVPTGQTRDNVSIEINNHNRL
jgi:hypothetical protein